MKVAVDIVIPSPNPSSTSYPYWAVTWWPSVGRVESNPDPIITRAVPMLMV